MVPEAEIPARAGRVLEIGAIQYISTQDFFQQSSHFFFRHPHPPLDLRQHREFLCQNVDVIRKCFATINERDWYNPLLNSTFGPLREYFAVHAAQHLGVEDFKEKVQLTKTVSRDLHYLMRWLVSFGLPGPGLMVTMELLGRKETLFRMDKGIETIKQSLVVGPEASVSS